MQTRQVAYHVGADEDGYLTAGPILVYQGAKLPVQPFMFLHGFVTPPSDEQLASGHVTRENFNRTMAESGASVTRELEGCAGGSYWVIVKLPGMEHYSFTDLPLLHDAGNSAKRANDLRALQLVRSYIRAGLQACAIAMGAMASRIFQVRSLSTIGKSNSERSARFPNGGRES
jgi:hypothetical protein